MFLKSSFIASETKEYKWLSSPVNVQLQYVVNLHIYNVSLHIYNVSLHI